MSEETLAARAKTLRAKAADLKSAPLWDRPAMAGDMVDEVAALVVDIALRVEALTPYQDEGADHVAS